MLIGLVRFIVEYSYIFFNCVENLLDFRLFIVKDFYYLYFFLFLFVVIGLVVIGISFMIKFIDRRCVRVLKE